LEDVAKRKGLIVLERINRKGREFDTRAQNRMDDAARNILRIKKDLGPHVIEEEEESGRSAHDHQESALAQEAELGANDAGPDEAPAAEEIALAQHSEPESGEESAAEEVSASHEDAASGAEAREPKAGGEEEEEEEEEGGHILSVQTAMFQLDPEDLRVGPSKP
jgi:hypothetical protein